METTAVAFYSLVGGRIAQARKAAGVRQAELAAELRISRAAVANIEAGQQTISVDRLIDIARALRVEPVGLVPELLSEPTPSDRPTAIDELEGMSAQLDEVERAWVEEILHDARPSQEIEHDNG